MLSTKILKWLFIMMGCMTIVLASKGIFAINIQLKFPVSTRNTEIFTDC